MKRTSMVILMQKALEEWQAENPEGGSFYDAMSFILGKQEDAGMVFADFMRNEWELE